jgi:hypothetical protein
MGLRVFTIFFVTIEKKKITDNYIYNRIAVSCFCLEATVALSIGLASRLSSTSTAHEVVAAPVAPTSGWTLASVPSSLDHDVCRHISHPFRPLDCKVLSLRGGSQGFTLPLLGVVFVLKLGSLTADVVHNPSVAFMSRMDWIWSPQLVALLVFLRNADARVDDVEMLETAGEQEVLIEGPAVRQTLPDVLLEAVLQPVGGVVSSHTAVDVKVTRHWRQEEDDPAFQEVEDRQAVSKKHVQSLLASNDELSFDVIFTVTISPNWQIPSLLRSGHEGNIIKTMNHNNVIGGQLS